MDNIPVVSWLLLGGRCRRCRSAIPVSYFLIELFSGLGAALAFAKYGWVAAACFMISEVGAILEGELTTEAQSTQRIGMDLSLALG